MKNAIVIGASSGIGEGFVRKLVREGYRVGMTGRRTVEMKRIRDEVGEDNALIREMDVTKTEEARKIFKSLTNEMAKDGGIVDMVVISAGVGKNNSMADWEISEWTNGVNVVGFTAIADAAIELFQKQKKGSLVGLSSIAGIKGIGDAPVYSASKGYERLYLEAAKQYFMKHRLDVNVTAVLPGFVDTELVKDNDRMFWVQPVEKAVDQAYAGIIKGKFYVVVTKRWRLMAWIMRALPRWVWFRAC
ncbi:putative oxidoreductase [Poriferisphaera corsica]|uniref:Putative oxidoreductase n=1 Tax=Poriferisphaera corsica TaxID=2528020 RepID=A0A517YRB3_9BACT|nr:SDR family NAD(P)-dependent oxidoreductase [Poriferisphaera corsica]QDU32760.1 putative oxidoreductase [Poriferisphaera corsica]